MARDVDWAVWAESIGWDGRAGFIVVYAGDAVAPPDRYEWADMDELITYAGWDHTDVMAALEEHGRFDCEGNVLIPAAASTGDTE